MLITTKYRSGLNFGGVTFTVLELRPLQMEKLLKNFLNINQVIFFLNWSYLPLCMTIVESTTINVFLKSLKIGVIFLCPEW